MRIADYVNKVLVIENPIKSLVAKRERDIPYLEMAYREVADRVEIDILEDMMSAEYALGIELDREFGSDQIIQERFIRARDSISMIAVDTKPGAGL